MTARIVEPQELSRSCNELLVMAALDRGVIHGYQLAVEIEERSEGVFRFNHGTLYPILHRLEEKGLVDAVVYDAPILRYHVNQSPDLAVHVLP